MKKFILVLSLLCVSLNAQEKVFQVSGGFSKKNNTKESFAIPNEINDDVMLLLNEQNLFKSILLDPEFNEKSKINTTRVSTFYTNLLGYTIYDNQYSLFFTNNRSKKFGVQMFDFDKRESSVKILEFKLKKETFIEAINYNNQIYILSVSKKTPDLNIYTFAKDFTVTKHVVSLKHLEYKNPFDGFKVSAHNIFKNNPIVKIESNNPNTIETTSRKIKLYQRDHQIILSLNHQSIVTQLQFLDLKTFELTHKNIKNSTHIGTGYKTNNSYIFENKLFYIASSNQKMKFSITDLATEKVIKEYNITKEDSIQFKNSPIIQEGGGMFPALSENRVRELEKTAKYLRKISAADLGISVYKVANQYNIILGGTKEIVTSNNFGGGGGFGFGGGFGNVNGFGGGFGGTIATSTAFFVSFNPTFYNYNSYYTTKSTYINCLFDENFEHVKGDVPLNSFDMLNDFEDTLKKPSAVTIFRRKQHLHFGYYDTEDEMYKLYKFEE